MLSSTQSNDGWEQKSLFAPAFSPANALQLYWSIMVYHGLWVFVYLVSANMDFVSPSGSEMRCRSVIRTVFNPLYRKGPAVAYWEDEQVTNCLPMSTHYACCFEWQRQPVRLQSHKQTMRTSFKQFMHVRAKVHKKKPSRLPQQPSVPKKDPSLRECRQILWIARRRKYNIRIE